MCRVCLSIPEINGLETVTDKEGGNSQALSQCGSRYIGDKQGHYLGTGFSYEIKFKKGKV
jgi:hypothetical protein